MTPDDLKARTKKFAVDVIRFAKTIPKDHIKRVRVVALERGVSAQSPTNRQSKINAQQPINNLKSTINKNLHLALPAAASLSRLRPKLRALAIA
jgi:hypothetical protein